MSLQCVWPIPALQNWLQQVLLPWLTWEPKRHPACFTRTFLRGECTTAKLHEHLEACAWLTTSYLTSRTSRDISLAACYPGDFPGKGNCWKCAIYFRVVSITTWKLMMTGSRARAWRPHACQATTFPFFPRRGHCLPRLADTRGRPFGMRQRFAAADVIRSGRPNLRTRLVVAEQLGQLCR